ncbi:hypothetical protein HDU84_002980 [Entophlyctis sp. JEL0112]|nr:hypothetical protein HDU84_002980 [Entophlyctis sp. JEL0112]
MTDAEVQRLEAVYDSEPSEINFNGLAARLFALVATSSDMKATLASIETRGQQYELQKD